MKIEQRPKWQTVRRAADISPSPDLPSSLYATAYHEAAHAVVADSFNVPSLEAIARDDGPSFVRYKEQKQEQDASRAPFDAMPAELKQIIATEVAAIYYAGVEAELLLTGAPRTGPLLRHCTDWLKAGVLLAETFGGGIGPVWYSQRLARAILTERWALVERVAHALVGSCTLNAGELRELLTRSPATAAGPSAPLSSTGA